MKWVTIGSVVVGILSAGAAWATLATGDDRPRTNFADIGSPVNDDALRGSRGQGLENAIVPTPGDVATIDVILWDEVLRQPSPPSTGGGSNGLSSTVNGASY